MDTTTPDTPQAHGMGRYADRILRVMDYIYDNPAGDLSLDALAEVAAMSRFHWHRVFHAMTGETLAEAVRRTRLHLAACWLIQTDRGLEEIATSVGYSSLQSFTRAFGEAYGQSPGAFRKAGKIRLARPGLTRGVIPMYSVEIKDQPPRRIAAVSHTGAYHEMGRAYDRLEAHLSAGNLWPRIRGMVGISYDDPDATPEADLRSHAGVIVADDFPMEGPLEEVHLDGGRHAILTLTGPYSGLAAAYRYLYGDWLAQSGEEAADRPSFEVYLNSPRDTAPQDLKTEICLPLA